MRRRAGRAAPRILALALSLALLPSLSACAGPEGTPGGSHPRGSLPAADGSGTGSGERQPYVERANYGKTFQALYCSDIFQNGYFFPNREDWQAGNDLDDRLYERILNIKDYLGVDVVGVDGGDHLAYGRKLRVSVDARDGAYQMVMTHVHTDVASLMLGRYLRDFGDFPNLNLEADYWNGDMMRDMAINGRMFAGYNDFCLAKVHLIAFNKDIAADHPAEMGDLYGLVRDREWTLDRMIALSELASSDDGDGRWTPKDAYGLAGSAWTLLIDFQTAADLPIVVRDPETNELTVAPMTERIVALTKKLYDFKKADCSFLWHYAAPPEGQAHIDGGRVLFEMMCSYDFIRQRGQSVRVGVLPYPLWDRQQENYRTLSWNGVLGIPSDVKADRMTGDTIEALAFYSGPVKTAFFENLLGTKVADSPDDAAMLDLIWSTQTVELGILLSETSSQLGQLSYAIPRLLLLHDSDNYASFYRSQARGARNGLRRMYERMGRGDDGPPPN